MDKSHNSNRIPEELAATEEEIRSAYKALSDEELRKLYRYACYFANWLFIRLGNYYNADDLLQEAITRTLERRRLWHKDSINFIQLLIGTMRSIKGQLIEKNIEGKLTRKTKDKYGHDPIDDMVAQSVNPGKSIDAKGIIETIEQRFADDSLALEVIEGWGSELKGPEIQQILNISQTQYGTICRRIRRGVQKLKNRGDINE